jgi:hypothetical protein
VCDGSALNDGSSPIFNGANRYLPNLDDSRFLMGSTTVGSTGGFNSQTATVTRSEWSTSVPSHYHGTGSEATNGSLFTALTGNNTTNTLVWEQINVTSWDGAVDNRQVTATGFDVIGNAGSTRASGVQIRGNTSSTVSSATITFSGTSNVTFSGNGTTTLENRPLYLGTVYIMRVK